MTATGPPGRAAVSGPADDEGMKSGRAATFVGSAGRCCAGGVQECGGHAEYGMGSGCAAQNSCRLRFLAASFVVSTPPSRWRDVLWPATRAMAGPCWPFTAGDASLVFSAGRRAGHRDHGRFAPGLPCWLPEATITPAIPGTVGDLRNVLDATAVLLRSDGVGVRAVGNVELIVQWSGSRPLPSSGRRVLRTATGRWCALLTARHQAYEALRTGTNPEQERYCDEQAEARNGPGLAGEMNDVVITHRVSMMVLQGGR